MGGYKVRQVGCYKVSLLRDFRMWGFIRSNRYFFVAAHIFFDQKFLFKIDEKGPQMGVYKVKWSFFKCRKWVFISSQDFQNHPQASDHKVKW